MKTVRRLYFYAVALISLEVVLWGLIGLLRSIFDRTIGSSAEALARAIALVLVGVPIFLFHWLWTQRVSGRDSEERVAALRAIFFYSVLIATLIPAVQNTLAYLNRTFIEVARLENYRAIFGGQQTLADNLIAVLINGVVAAYFWNTLQGVWRSLVDPASGAGQENFTAVRRLYRYVWVLYGLLMVIFGAQQVLRFLFYVPSGALGDLGREIIVNGLALLVVGTPIWVYAWRVVQDSLADAAERESNLRLGFLYLLALSGVITVLTTTAMLVNIILVRVLGAAMSSADFIHQIGTPISVGIPLGAVWAYYGFWLNRHIESTGDPVRQSGMKRVYAYILSALGLGGAFIGVAALFKFIIDLLTGGSLILNDALRSQLATAISLIVAWLPLWLMTWRPMQAEALAEGKDGDHARRSVIRKTYLYLALFAGVIGGMIAAVALVFELLRALLMGQVDSSFLSTVLNDLQLLILFVILLFYHLTVLRRDGTFTASALAAKQSDFKVLVLDSGDGFAEAVQAALAKFAPNVPVTVASEKPQGNFNALVLSGGVALNAPDWVRSFRGSRVIVPTEAKDLIWAGGVHRQVVQQAAQALRQLAEGQEVHQGTGLHSAWMIVVYIAAALFGLELLFMALGLLLSTFANQ
jgi:hypothetical protein